MKEQLNSSLTDSSRYQLRHAVVIGGSMSGLPAARALCDHFKLVAIIERSGFRKNLSAQGGAASATSARSDEPGACAF